MNILNYTPSPKFKEICYKYLQYLEDNNIYDIKFVQDILGKEIPLPILYLASDLLYRNGLIKYNKDYNFVKPALPKESWAAAIDKIQISDVIIRNFESNLKSIPYSMPKDGKITFRELTEEEYLKRSEFYDYEIATLFNSNGLYNSWWLNTDYLHRSFKIIHDEKMKGKKRLHIFVAERDNSILGYISISNYVKGVDMFFNHGLPCQDEDIFYVNYIQSRQEAHRKYIGTCLVGLALNKVFYEDNAYAVAYEPICAESEKMFSKVAKHMKLDLYERKYNSSIETKKYGSLKSHILTKKEENTYSFDEELYLH